MSALPSVPWRMATLFAWLSAEPDLAQEARGDRGRSLPVEAPLPRPPSQDRYVSTLMASNLFDPGVRTWITRLDEHRFEVNRAVVALALGELHQVGRRRSHFSSRSEELGLRLIAIRRHDLLDELGFKNGDILSVGRALFFEMSPELLAVELEDADELCGFLYRRGQPRVHCYELR